MNCQHEWMYVPSLLTTILIINVLTSMLLVDKASIKSAAFAAVIKVEKLLLFFAKVVPDFRLLVRIRRCWCIDESISRRG